jgi:hypothetical protein
MIDIDVRSNIKEVAGFLRHIDKRLIKYCTIVALTRTAWDAQKEVVDQIPKRFNNKKKWWMARQPTGIKVNRATKARLVSEVYSDAYFLPLQETGGTKLPFQGRGILIPTKHTPIRGRNARGVKKVLSTKKTLRKGGKPDGSPIFFVNGKWGVFRRRTKKRYPLVMVYGYRHSVHIDPRFGFEDTVRKKVQQIFNKHFVDVFRDAIHSR